MTISIRPYTPGDRAAWNAFVLASKNGTFLFDRGYMEYHSDRFSDRSYIAESDGEIIALFPANARDTDLYSHQGLTFGSFVVDTRMTTPAMIELFEVARRQWKEDGFSRVHYKTIPTIYASAPAEEDRYALFLCDAPLVRRDVLCAVWPGRRLEFQTRRVRGVKKAIKAGVEVTETNDFGPYWNILAENLLARYGVKPVHTLEEIEMLRSTFPENIRLFEARMGAEVLGGVVLYETPRVSHVQYIASTEQGRSEGALDLLFQTLIERADTLGLIFDMGISNEDNGRTLNRGLIEQKEGFGGRALVHDFYEIRL
jgi:hypothetical protein